MLLHVEVAGNVLARAESRQRMAERRVFASILRDIRDGRTEANASRRTRSLIQKAWRSTCAVDRAYQTMTSG